MIQLVNKFLALNIYKCIEYVCMYVASMVLASSSTLRYNICATANIVADEVSSIAELSFSKETKGNYY